MHNVSSTVFQKAQPRLCPTSCGNTEQANRYTHGTQKRGGSRGSSLGRDRELFRQGQNLRFGVPGKDHPMPAILAAPHSVPFRGRCYASEMQWRDRCHIKTEELSLDYARLTYQSQIIRGDFSSCAPSRN